MNPEETGSLDAFIQATEKPELVPIIEREVMTGWTPETVYAIWGPLFPAGVVVSLILGIGVLYCVLRIIQIRRIERENFRKAGRTVEAGDVPRTQLRWNRILEHARSDDEHQWRLAILEADIMLNELLDVHGYKGETIAEKMKQVNRASFNSIDDAWEAHKVRNRVAHEGSEHPLSEREKNRVLTLYQRVFNEFGFIDDVR